MPGRSAVVWLMRGNLSFELHHFADVFAYNIKFQIDYRTFFDLAEVRIIMCIRNNSHFKAILL